MSERLDHLKRAVKRVAGPVLERSFGDVEKTPLSAWGLDVENGALTVDGVALHTLVEEHGSPLFVLLEERLRARMKEFRSPGPLDVEVAYSYKTNPVPGVLAILHDEGAGAEVISPYELWLAFKLGVPPEKIIYGGPAKSDASLRDAVAAEIGLININHAEEIERVEAAAKAVGKRARVGIRVSAPGGWAMQFGSSLEDGEAREVVRRAHRSDHLDVVGLHAHRGTLIRSAADLESFVGPVLELALALKRDDGIDIRVLDLGGSLAVPTVNWLSGTDRRLNTTFLVDQREPDAASCIRPAEHVAVLGRLVKSAYDDAGLPPPRVVIEPGRAVTASSMVMLTSVITTKSTSEPPQYAILDAGINAAESVQHEYHRAVCANRAGVDAETTWRLVGPTCTPGDVLYPAWHGPALASGDVIAILDAGAYFIPFSTTFSFPRAAVVALKHGAVRTLRRAETFDDLVLRDLP